MPSQNIPRIDLTGQKFGRLKVIEFAGYEKCRYDKSKRQAAWLVKCDCGVKKTIAAKSLRGGVSSSCGCARQKHGHSAGRRGTPVSPTYKTWAAMLSRCNNQAHTYYRYYGGRGVTVCKKWGTFEGFLADMGERPEGMTLDRIDPNGNYSPENCRWSSMKDQAQNRRNNRLVTFAGETKVAAEWARELGVSPRAIWDRYKQGLPIDKPIEFGKRRKDNQWVMFNGQRKLAKQWAKEIGISATAVWNRHKIGWPIDKPMPWGTNRKQGAS